MKARFTVRIVILVAALAPAVSLASNTNGSGTSLMACSGGMPYPCARQDPAPYQAAVLPAPTVGVPIILPGSGERLIRVTDTNYYSPVQSPPQTFNKPEDGAMSLYDPAIPGYWVIAVNGGNGLYLSKMTYPGFSFTRIWSTADSSKLVPLDAVFNFSKVSPGLAFGTSVGYGGASDQVYAYSFPGEASDWTNNTADTRTPIFDASTSKQGLATGCATSSINFPGFVGPYGGGASTAQDNTVLIYAGGNAQDHDHLVLVGQLTGTHAAPTWNCSWIDTTTMKVTYGGVTHDTGWAFPAPATAPVTSFVTGSLASSPTTIVTTVVAFNKNLFGSPSDIAFPETLASPSTTVTPNGSQAIQITKQTLPSGATNPQIAWYTDIGTSNVPYEWGVYACQGTGCTPTLQAYVAWGTSTYTLTSVVAGATLPTVNNAGIYLHGAGLDSTGQYVRISTATDANQVGGFIYWQLGTSNIFTCTDYNNADTTGTVGAFCAGHPGGAPGSLVNAYSTTPFTDLGTYIRPINNLTAHTQLITNPPPPQYINQDTHYGGAINSSYPTSIIPYFANYYANSDGTQNATNPVRDSTIRAFVNEIDAFSLATPNTWWRFGHTRAACLNNNTIGQSITEIAAYELCPQPGGGGQFIEFNSNWDWQLGTSAGVWTASAAAYAYGVRQTSTGSNVWELALNTGTSASTPPSWNTGIGQTTVDNPGASQITWETIPGCPAGTSFPKWASGQAIALNYVLQTPFYNFEQLTTLGSPASMPSTQPAWPEWMVTSATSSGSTASVVLSGGAAIPTVGQTIVVWSVNNPGTTNTQAFDGTFTVATSSGSTITYTDSQLSGGISGTGGIAMLKTATTTDSNGNVWKMWPAANVSGTYQEGPQIGQNVARAQCRQDLFLVETK